MRMCPSRTRSSLTMGVKEGSLEEVSDEHVLDGKGRERNVSAHSMCKSPGAARRRNLF